MREDQSRDVVNVRERDRTGRQTEPSRSSGGDDARARDGARLTRPDRVVLVRGGTAMPAQKIENRRNRVDGRYDVDKSTLKIYICTTTAFYGTYTTRHSNCYRSHKLSLDEGRLRPPGAPSRSASRLRPEPAARNLATAEAGGGGGQRRAGEEVARVASQASELASILTDRVQVEERSACGGRIEVVGEGERGVALGGALEEEPLHCDWRHALLGGCESEAGARHT